MSRSVSEASSSAPPEGRLFVHQIATVRSFCRAKLFSTPTRLPGVFFVRKDNCASILVWRSRCASGCVPAFVSVLTDWADKNYVTTETLQSSKSRGTATSRCCQVGMQVMSFNCFSGMWGRTASPLQQVSLSSTPFYCLLTFNSFNWAGKPIIKQSYLLQECCKVTDKTCVWSCKF